MRTNRQSEWGPRLAGAWAFLIRPVPRYVLAWLTAGVVAAVALFNSWVAFNDPKRKDGNQGHAYIDFGGQYLMGRMLVRGFRQHLYDRAYQRLVLSEVYPVGNEDPSKPSDVEEFMTWLMGKDDPKTAEAIAPWLLPFAADNGAGRALSLAAVWKPDELPRALYPDPPPVGGPLYPPIHALLYYPLALLPAQPAYRTFQVIDILLAFVAGLGIRVVSRGRVWCPVAAAALICFPGFAGALNLAQNPPVTLAIAVWGWALLARGRPGWAGAVWGLLAFKPVWAMTFFLVPLLTGRWRFCLAMVVTGAALSAATLPVVGLHAWQDWLAVGREATETYKADVAWIHLSRDLLSIPRRWLDFGEGASYFARLENFPVTLAGWALLVAVFELTVRLAIFRREQVRQVTGPGPAFLLLGSWLCCFHFMYYDVLLAALPVLLLFTEPRQYLNRRFLMIVPLGRRPFDPALDRYYQPALAEDYPAEGPFVQAGPPHVWLVNPAEPIFVVALMIASAAWRYYDVPYDTLTLMALWLWCGWRCVRPAQEERQEPRPDETKAKELSAAGPGDAAQLVELGADVRGPH